MFSGSWVEKPAWENPSWPYGYPVQQPAASELAGVIVKSENDRVLTLVYWISWREGLGGRGLGVYALPSMLGDFYSPKTSEPLLWALLTTIADNAVVL